MVSRLSPADTATWCWSKWHTIFDIGPKVNEAGSGGRNGLPCGHEALQALPALGVGGYPVVPAEGLRFVGGPLDTEEPYLSHRLVTPDYPVVKPDPSTCEAASAPKPRANGGRRRDRRTGCPDSPAGNMPKSRLSGAVLGAQGFKSLPGGRV